MALSVLTRRKLAAALGSESAAAEVKTIVDAETGSLSVSTQRRIWNALHGTQMGVVLCAAIEADTVLTSLQKSKLTQILGQTAMGDFSSHQDAGGE